MHWRGEEQKEVIRSRFRWTEGRSARYARIQDKNGFFANRTTALLLVDLARKLNWLLGVGGTNQGKEANYHASHL